MPPVDERDDDAQRAVIVAELARLALDLERLAQALADLGILAVENPPSVRPGDDRAVAELKRRWLELHSRQDALSRRLAALPPASADAARTLH